MFADFQSLRKVNGSGGPPRPFHSACRGELGRRRWIGVALSEKVVLWCDHLAGANRPVAALLLRALDVHNEDGGVAPAQRDHAD